MAGDDARDAVLRRVRRALGRDNGQTSTGGEAKPEPPRPHPIPARAQRLDAEGRIELFTEEAEAVATEVRRVARYAELPQAVATYLRAHNLPAELVMAPDPLLDRADWGAAMLDVRRGTATAADQVGVTAAFAGVAETGTLMLVSGPANPVMLGFLPETCIVALPAERIVGTYEEGWRRRREAQQGSGGGSSPLPRSVNLITGPSRSGDIEQTLQLGAHGPRRLLVLIVDEPAAS